ncbi:MAG: dephospho-CoA kinase [Chloroflexi bacterium]|nr:dephospho-CoA kinase [Chloroflexota bacterium]
MSAWPGKFVIGLTGNIATGKSVVRKMLEHAGAFGIDADALSNRAILPDAPGYQPVVDAFGQYILNENGEIDRAKLAQIVFSDPEALALLEAIVHSLVLEAVDLLVRKSKSDVVVIEAIKLLESPLSESCDVIWVTTANRRQQITRLTQQRGLDLGDAQKRMDAQSSQEAKVTQADTVINNDGSIENTWEQVKAAWKLLFPEVVGKTVPTELRKFSVSGNGSVLRLDRARPRQAELIAEFMNANGAYTSTNAENIMTSFGEKAYLLLQAEDGLNGVIGWKVENLVARLDDIYLSEKIPLQQALSVLIEEVEQASRELQCEVALFFVNPILAEQKELWSLLGYEARLPQSLSNSAWREAAVESAGDQTEMFFKQLRSDLVLRPI